MKGNTARCAKWRQTHRKQYNEYMKQYRRKKRNG